MQVDIRTQCPRCRADVPAAAGYCHACGYAQPGNQPEITVADPKAQAALLPTRPSPAALVTLVTTVIAVLATTTPILVVRWAFFGPDDSVRDYFAALADRDADGAWSYVVDEDDSRAGQPALAASVLRHADYTPPSGFKLGEVSVDGDSATASVRYEIAGTPYDETLSLTRLGGPSHTFQRWHIRDGLRELPIAAGAVPAIVVAGATVYAEGSPQLLVFPGAYTLRLPESPLIDAEPVTVSTGNGERVALTTRLRDTARQQIDREVQTYLSGCAAKAQAAPAGCPFGISSYYYEITSISWKITRYPTLSYTVTDERTVEVETTQAGTAEANGRTTSVYSPTFTDSQPIWVSGVAVADGTGVTFNRTS